MSLPARCVHKKTQSTSNPNQQDNVCNFRGLSALRQQDSWPSFPHRSHPMSKKCYHEVYIEKIHGTRFPINSPWHHNFITNSTFHNYRSHVITGNADLLLFMISFLILRVENSRPEFLLTVIKCWENPKFQVNSSTITRGALKGFMRYMSLSGDSAIVQSWVTHTNYQCTIFFTYKVEIVPLPTSLRCREDGIK